MPRTYTLQQFREKALAELEGLGFFMRPGDFERYVNEYGFDPDNRPGHDRYAEADVRHLIKTTREALEAAPAAEPIVEPAPSGDPRYTGLPKQGVRKLFNLYGTPTRFARFVELAEVRVEGHGRDRKYSFDDEAHVERGRKIAEQLSAPRSAAPQPDAAPEEPATAPRPLPYRTDDLPEPTEDTITITRDGLMEKYGIPPLHRFTADDALKDAAQTFRRTDGDREYQLTNRSLRNVIVSLRVLDAE